MASSGHYGVWGKGLAGCCADCPKGVSLCRSTAGAGTRSVDPQVGSSLGENFMNKISLVGRLFLTGLVAFSCVTGSAAAAAPMSDPIRAGQHVVLPPDGGGSAPLCGSTVELSAVSYTYYPQVLNQGINGADFKVVGTGLAKWLGNGGFGTLHVFRSDYSGTTDLGVWNASAAGGARTSTLHGKLDINISGGRSFDVTAFIEKGSDTKCGKVMTISLPGPGA